MAKTKNHVQVLNHHLLPMEFRITIDGITDKYNRTPFTLDWIRKDNQFHGQCFRSNLNQTRKHMIELGYIESKVIVCTDCKGSGISFFKYSSTTNICLKCKGHGKINILTN
jgi:hypothetical protein